MVSFRSQIIDINLGFEFNFKKFKIHKRKTIYSPYIFAGLSFFTFNPQAQNNLDQWVDLQNLGTEGQETEANANTGELMGTMEVLGLDVSAGGLWNIDKSGEDFIDLNKTMLNFSHTLSDQAKVYLKNDFNTDWDRTESTIGIQVTF